MQTCPVSNSAELNRQSVEHHIRILEQELYSKIREYRRAVLTNADDYILDDLRICMATLSSELEDWKGLKRARFC